MGEQKAVWPGSSWDKTNYKCVSCRLYALSLPHQDTSWAHPLLNSLTRWQCWPNFTKFIYSSVFLPFFFVQPKDFYNSHVRGSGLGLKLSCMWLSLCQGLVSQRLFARYCGFPSFPCNSYSTRAVSHRVAVLLKLLSQPSSLLSSQPFVPITSLIHPCTSTAVCTGRGCFPAQSVPWSVLPWGCPHTWSASAKG